MINFIFVLLGTAFGFILSNSQVISWYRVQEMFRFDSFHMYGVILTAIVTGAVLIWLLKRLGVKAFNGEKISISDKKFNWGYVIGGTIFGIGWVFTGACPGPLYALVGNGFYMMVLALLGAIAGTWTYSLLRPKLPH